MSAGTVVGIGLLALIGLGGFWYLSSAREAEARSHEGPVERVANTVSAIGGAARTIGDLFGTSGMGSGSIDKRAQNGSDLKDWWG